MATPFLSSEEYDERAHQLYNEGQYDDALTVLREGLMLYPNSVELHVGVGYAQLAREEYAWARRSFEQALVLEPEPAFTWRTFCTIRVSSRRRCITSSARIRTTTGTSWESGG